MAENFEINKAEYTEYADKIRLSDTQKNVLVSAMQNAESDETKVYPIKGHKIWTKAVAAVLSLAMIGSVIYFARGIGQNKNSFTITANAAEIGSSEVNLASGEMDSGFPMTIFKEDGAEPYLNQKIYKRDLFHSFRLTKLSVNGENIESITFKANKNTTYFNLLTDNYNNEFINIQAPANSQYTTDEFVKHYDGFFGYVCDGFTFENLYDGNEIRLDNKVAFMLESDWTDSEIAEWMEVVCECYDKKTEYKQELYYETGGVGGGYISDEQIETDEKMVEYMDKIIAKTLDGATVDITVQFTDGAEQTKTLVLGYDNSGENSFLTARLAE